MTRKRPWIWNFIYEMTAGTGAVRVWWYGWNAVCSGAKNRSLMLERVTHCGTSTTPPERGTSAAPFYLRSVLYMEV